MLARCCSRANVLSWGHEETTERAEGCGVSPGPPGGRVGRFGMETWTTRATFLSLYVD